MKTKYLGRGGHPSLCHPLSELHLHSSELYLHSSKENYKTRRRYPAQTACSVIQQKFLLDLYYFLKNSVCVGFQCTKYRRVGECTFNSSERVRTGENCGAGADVLQI